MESEYKTYRIYIPTHLRLCVYLCILYMNLWKFMFRYGLIVFLNLVCSNRCIWSWSLQMELIVSTWTVNINIPSKTILILKTLRRVIIRHPVLCLLCLYAGTHVLHQHFIWAIFYNLIKRNDIYTAGNNAQAAALL